MTLIVHGWLARARILSDGRRQIFNFILPGDIVAPDERFSLPTSIIALTPVEAIDLRAACQTIRRDTGAASGIERAYGQAVQAEYHLILDHIVRLGALSAVERVAHLLLELDERLSDVGLVDRDRFVFPVRQEHLADSLGMSLVHMNRSLQRLRHDNLIGLTEGWLTLLDRRRLAAIAHFDRGAGASARRQDLGADLILGSARSRQAKSDRLLPARADTGQSAVALDG